VSFDQIRNPQGIQILEGKKVVNERDNETNGASATLLHVKDRWKDSLIKAI
jgi:hypothetical protein